MTIILRLQGLPWSASSMDIREFFAGMSIPDGGVHIVGGETGDVFIAFSTDEDARKAMQKQSQPLCGSRVTILLSSKSEMQEVIAKSRSSTPGRRESFPPSSTSQQLSSTQSPTSPIAAETNQVTQSSTSYFSTSTNHPPAVTPSRNGSKVTTDDPAVYGSFVSGDRYSSYGYAYGKPSESGFIGTFDERPTEKTIEKSLNVGGQSVSAYEQTPTNLISKPLEGRPPHTTEQWASEQDLYGYQRYEKDLRQNTDQTYGQIHRQQYEGSLSTLGKLSEGTHGRGADQLLGTYSDPMYSSYTRKDDKQQTSQKVDPTFQFRGDILAQKNYDAPGSEKKSSSAPVDLNNQGSSQRDQQRTIPPIPDNLVERLRDVFPLTGLAKLGSLEDKKPDPIIESKSHITPSSQSFQGTNPNVSYSVAGFNSSAITRQKFASDEHQHNISYRSQQDSLSLPSTLAGSSKKDLNYSQYKNTSQNLFPSAGEKSFPELVPASQRSFPSYGLQDSRLESNIKPKPAGFPYDTRMGQQRDTSKFGSADTLGHEQNKRMKIHDTSPERVDDDYYEDPAFPGKPLGFEEAIPGQEKDASFSDPYKRPSKAAFEDRVHQFGRKVPSRFDRPPGRQRVSRFDESFDRSTHKSPDTFEKPFGKKTFGHLEDPREKQFGIDQRGQKLAAPAEGLRQRFDEPSKNPREPSYEKQFGREPDRGSEEPLVKRQTNPELRPTQERYAIERTRTPEDDEYGRRSVTEGPVGRIRDRSMPFDESPGNARYDREGMPFRFPERPEFPRNAPLLGPPSSENMEKSFDPFPPKDFRGRQFGEPRKERPIENMQKDVVVMDNLPIDCEEGNVLNFFHGLSIAPDGIRMQIDTNTGRKTGRALVQFLSVMDASDALKRSREMMKGRPITISKCPLDEWNAATGGKVGIASEEVTAGLDAKDKSLGTVERAVEGPRARPLLEIEDNRHFMGRGPMPFRARGPRPPMERAPRPRMERGPRQRFEAEIRQPGELGPRPHLKGQIKPLLEQDELSLGEMFAGSRLRARIPDHDARDITVRPPFPQRERSPFRDSHTCIELRGLPFNAETKDIVDFFEGIQVARGSVFVERGTDGKVVGRCFLELADPIQLDLALHQNGKMMGKRPIDVSQVPHTIMLQRISEAEKRMADRLASLREEKKPADPSRDGKLNRDRAERSRNSRDRERDRGRDRDRSRDSNRERERERERDRGREREREREKERRDKDRSRDRDRSKERDRPRERDRNDDKDRRDEKEKKKESFGKDDVKAKSSNEPNPPDKVDQPPVSKENLETVVQPKQIKPLMPTEDKLPAPAVAKENPEASIPSLLAPTIKTPLPLPTKESTITSNSLKAKAPTVGLLPEPNIPEEHKTTGIILMRNIPYVSTENDIAQFLSGLRVIPGGIRMIRLADGKFNGQAYVEFANQGEADRAMERRQMVMRDRVIQMSLSTKAAMMQAIRAPPPPPFNPTVTKPGPIFPPSRFEGGPPRPRLLRPGIRMGAPSAGVGRGSAIIVGNLNETVSVPMLANLFAEYAIVPGGIRIGVDPTGRPLGEAKVAFPSRDEAIRVVRELNGVMFAGRRLQLNVIS